MGIQEGGRGGVGCAVALRVSCEEAGRRTDDEQLPTAAVSRPPLKMDTVRPGPYGFVGCSEALTSRRKREGERDLCLVENILPSNLGFLFLFAFFSFLHRAPLAIWQKLMDPLSRMFSSAQTIWAYRGSKLYSESYRNTKKQIGDVVLHVVRCYFMNKITYEVN